MPFRFLLDWNNFNGFIKFQGKKDNSFSSGWFSWPGLAETLEPPGGR
jgi:hypothetical protein